MGFEPTVPFGTAVFKTAALNHSAISPCLTLDDPLQSTHVGTEDSGNSQGTVGFLIIFEDGDEGAADRQPGAVDGMDEFRLGAFFAAKTDTSTPRLKVTKIGAGGNFAIGLLAGEPDFEIESARRCKEGKPVRHRTLRGGRI